MAERWEFGAQSVEELAPDVIRVSLVGTVDGPELAAVYAALRAWAAPKPYFFSLVDVSGFVTSTPASRTVTFNQPTDPRGTTLMFGLRFATRMLIELTLRAKRRLKPESSPQIHMVASEAEALAEVARLRPQLEAKAKRP
jgi:hypothetical protein